MFFSQRRGSPFWIGSTRSWVPTRSTQSCACFPRGRSPTSITRKPMTRVISTTRSWSAGRMVAGRGRRTAPDRWPQQIFMHTRVGSEHMNGEILEDFEDVSGWSAITSGQTRLHISQDQGRRGKAMRLDFDFQVGGGFVVARKAFALALPESYTVGCDIRGAAPSNIFEFKLVDASNLNVWRYR